MDNQIIYFIKENQSISLPIIFFLVFSLFAFIGFKQYRIHYKDNKKSFAREFKESFRYHLVTSFIDWHYHIIPYIYVIEDLEEESIEDFSIDLYRHFSYSAQSNYLFFVIAKKQRLIRINLGEELKFVLSLEEAEELLDKLIENVEFNSFIMIWQEVKKLCKERIKTLNVRSFGLNLVPLSFSYVARGMNPKRIDKNGNLDTFNSDDLYEKCIGITKKY